MSIEEDFHPLERAFFAEAAQDPHYFPSKHNYAERYRVKVGSLRSTIYPNIDAGLSALSNEKGGVYTGHDSSHFDEVVAYAGQLLGDFKDNLSGFSPYEIYLLLMAIRIHDVGNISGREMHETRCMEVLEVISDISDDAFENQQINAIARAHGGRHIEYGKDTIGALEEEVSIGCIGHVRKRALAAITRFADEICETSRRANTFLLLQRILPAQSEIYHQYAHSVKASQIAQNRELDITYQIDDTLLSKKWSFEEEDYYLADFILYRLEKLNTERLYYNQYVDAALQVPNIRAKIQIMHNHDVKHQIVIQTVINGYPDKGNVNYWRAKYSEFGGANLEARFANGATENDGK